MLEAGRRSEFEVAAGDVVLEFTLVLPHLR
jgi:hypothetical protein